MPSRQDLVKVTEILCVDRPGEGVPVSRKEPRVSVGGFPASIIFKSIWRQDEIIDIATNQNLILLMLPENARSWGQNKYFAQVGAFFWPNGNCCGSLRFIKATSLSGKSQTLNTIKRTNKMLEKFACKDPDHLLSSATYSSIHLVCTEMKMAGCRLLKLGRVDALHYWYSWLAVIPRLYQVTPLLINAWWR